MPIGRVNNLLCYLVVFLVFFLPAIDTDLGWHLIYGQYILEHGKILKDNTLTYFLPNYHWAYSTGLFDLLTAVLYKGGLLALALAYSVLMTFCFWLFNRINKLSPAFALCTFLLCTSFGWNVFYLGWRAQVFTFFFLVFELWVLDKSEKNQKMLSSLPMIFAIWANIHGGFVLGLLLLCLKTLENLYLKKWKHALIMSVALVGSALSVLINPYGYRVYQESLLHAQYPLQELIAEWVPPSGFVKGIGAATVGVLMWFLWKTKNPKRIFYSLLLLLGFILSFQARRNTAIFGLFAGGVALNAFRNGLTHIEKHPKFKQISFLALLGLVTILLIFQVPQTVKLSADWKMYCSQGLRTYPCRAIEYVRTNPVPDTNVYTAYEWGGFLEWQLPQYKYFVDGRMPAWPTPSGKSPYTEYLEIIQAKPGYQEKLDKYGTDWLLIGAGTFLDLELGNNKTTLWQNVYRDDITVIYIKKTQ